MRIYTDGDKSHRERDIRDTAEHFDTSKTGAIMQCVRFAPALDDAVAHVLARDDLTLEQNREIADTLSVGGRRYKISQSVERE